MFAARSLYAEIGREVERQGLDSVSHRAVVSGSRKLRLLGAALVRSGLPALLDTVPTEAPARYLVDAACEAPSPDPRVEFQGRVGWVLDLFERLERADQGKLA
jgi:phytoene synthase